MTMFERRLCDGRNHVTDHRFILVTSACIYVNPCLVCVFEQEGKVEVTEIGNRVNRFFFFL